MTAGDLARTTGLAIGLVGCAAPGGDDVADGTSAGSTDPGSTTMGTTSPSTTTAPATTESGTDTSATSTGDPSGSSGSTDADLQRCGIEDLAPGAVNPLVASDRMPMRLPTEIADILARSCGCHLADDLVIPGDYPASGTLDITTWPAWQSPFGDVPTYEAARAKLDPRNPILVMPPHTCDVGDGETMLPADRARMLEWIVALAPDGVTWSQR